MSKSFMDSIYGPLNSDYCIYFYVLSVFGFVLLVIAIISTLIIGITQKKETKFYVEMFMLCVAHGLMYFHNRLLLSMCNGSTKEGMPPPLSPSVFSGNTKPVSMNISSK